MSTKMITKEINSVTSLIYERLNPFALLQCKRVSEEPRCVLLCLRMKRALEPVAERSTTRNERTKCTIRRQLNAKHDQSVASRNKRAEVGEWLAIGRCLQWAVIRPNVRVVRAWSMLNAFRASAKGGEFLCVVTGVVSINIHKYKYTHTHACVLIVCID